MMVYIPEEHFHPKETVEILELLREALAHVDDARNIGISIEETGEYDDIIYPIEKIESLINDVIDIVENEHSKRR